MGQIAVLLEPKQLWRQTELALVLRVAKQVLQMDFLHQADQQADQQVQGVDLHNSHRQEAVPQ